MPFDRIDRVALERARECGFNHESIHVPDSGRVQLIYKINFGSNISHDLTATEIVAAIEALLRFSGVPSTTFWINIDSDIIPPSLVDAIEQAGYFQPRLYVSFKDTASHGPAPSLPSQIQTAIQRSAGHGDIWHPILNLPVKADPIEARRQLDL